MQNKFVVFNIKNKKMFYGLQFRRYVEILREKKHYFSLTMFAFTSWRTLSKTEFLLLKTFSHASFYVKLLERWK